MKKLTIGNAQQIGNYFKTFYETNGQPLRDNPERFDKMQKRFTQMLRNACERNNCTLERGEHISKTDTMTYVVIAKRNNPAFPDLPYVVWTYDAEHDGFYNGYYDIATYDDARHIMENRQS